MIEDASPTRRPGRALSLMAHPDDAEFLCAGTLALLARRGWQITIVTATPGDCGSAEVPAEEIAAIRRQEAARSAAVIGAAYFCLEERDLAIDYDTPTRRKVVQALRSARPDLVFTHPLADYMVDHEVVGRLVRDACFAAPMPNFQAPGGDPPLDHIPHLYYCDSFMGAGGETWADALVIDVSDAIEARRRMLAEHHSQREWLRRQHGVDEYMRLQEEISRHRGEDRGFHHGEGFYQHRGHPYPQDDRLSAALQEPTTMAP